MSQSLNQKSNSQQPDVKMSLKHQANDFKTDTNTSVIEGISNRYLQGDGNKSVQGDGNKSVQGDGNAVCDIKGNGNTVTVNVENVTHQKIPQLTFKMFVEDIAVNFHYLECLLECDANRRWKKLDSALPESFGVIELEIVRLVFSYCCYFSNALLVPSANYKVSSKKEYYSLARKIARQGKIKCTDKKLSTIIQDLKMRKIIQKMEVA